MDGKNNTASYSLTQIFGDKNGRVAEEDIISAVEFDQTGKYLSLGDRAGRLIIFDAQQQKNKKTVEFGYYTEVPSESIVVPVACARVRPAAQRRHRRTNSGHYLA